MPDIVITDVRALAPTPDGLRVERCDIVIEGGVIVALTTPGAAPPATQTIAGGGSLAIPGLVNAHTHSPENLSRGRSESTRLSDWLAQVWPAIDALPPADIALAIEWGAAEMLRHGVTGVVDHFRQTPMSEQALSAAIDAYARIGMRSMIAVMLRDAATSSGGVVGVAHVKAVPSAAEQIAMVVDAHASASARGVQLAFGPSAPHRCLDRLLNGLAGTNNTIAIHTHVDETAEEYATAVARFGVSEIAHLDRLGLLGPRTSCVHVVHSTADDFALMAAKGAVAVHNPVSNLRLGVGITPLASMLRAGVNVALGTDGAASNDSQNPWEVVKAAALLPRIASRDATAWPSSETMLALATRMGHRVFGSADAHAGTLAVGAPADIAVFADDDFDPIDPRRPAASLVLGSTARRARHVIARGRVLLRDGSLATIDEDRLRRRIDDYRKEAA